MYDVSVIPSVIDISILVAVCGSVVLINLMCNADAYDVSDWVSAMNVAEALALSYACIVLAAWCPPCVCSVDVCVCVLRWVDAVSIVCVYLLSGLSLCWCWWPMLFLSLRVDIVSGCLSVGL